MGDGRSTNQDRVVVVVVVVVGGGCGGDQSEPSAAPPPFDSGRNSIESRVRGSTTASRGAPDPQRRLIFPIEFTLRYRSMSFDNPTPFRATGRSKPFFFGFFFVNDSFRVDVVVP